MINDEDLYGLGVGLIRVVNRDQEPFLEFQPVMIFARHIEVLSSRERMLLLAGFSLSGRKYCAGKYAIIISDQPYSDVWSQRPEVRLALTKAGYPRYLYEQEEMAE